MPPARRSSRRHLSSAATKDDNEEPPDEPEGRTTKPKTKRKATTTTKKSPKGSASSNDDGSSSGSSGESLTPKRKKRVVKSVKTGTPKKGARKKKSTAENSDASDDIDFPKETKRDASKSRSKTAKTSDDEKAMPKKKKARAPKHQVITSRDAIPKLWSEAQGKKNNSYTFRIATWNVAGLRALVNKQPAALSTLCEKHQLDVLCLQETKLQESHLTDPKLNLSQFHPAGYQAHYSCSTTRKGYSGTAVFVKDHKRGEKKQSTLDAFVKPKKGSKQAVADDTRGSGDKFMPEKFDTKNLTPTDVIFQMGLDKHDDEGRIIVLKFPLFTLVNTYVPNSGAQLARLDYRTKEWDVDFLAFMKKLPNVLWCGDLNVAHTNLEVWNDGAKHLATQAGVTEQERKSFSDQLDAGYVDAFRHLHPTAAGHYTYWSQRSGNREPNKGLRLDYFICSPSLLDEASTVVVRDSYMDSDWMGSDHCPAILEMEVKSE